MSDLFNPESRGSNLLTTVCDLIVVNLLFIITSLPIITIGASLTSLYNITFQIVNGETILYRDFFKTFTKKFVKSTLVWISTLVVLSILVFNLYLVYNVISKDFILLQIPIFIVLFIVIILIVYAFPLLSQFNDKLSTTIKNAILLGLGNFPTSVFLTVLHGSIIFFLLLKNTASVVIFSLLLFFGLSLIALVDSFFLNRIFQRRIITEEDQSAEEAE